MNATPATRLHTFGRVRLLCLHMHTRETYESTRLYEDILHMIVDDNSGRTHDSDVRSIILRLSAVRRYENIVLFGILSRDSPRVITGLPSQSASIRVHTVNRVLYLPLAESLLVFLSIEPPDSTSSTWGSCKSERGGYLLEQ